MLGFGSKKQDDSRLPVFVQTVQDPAAFAAAQKVWNENIRAVRIEPSTRKEFLRFGLVKEGQAVWFERDQGRSDSFELILTWRDSEVRVADVYVITPGNGGASSGDAEYIQKVFAALLSTPATLPAGNRGGN